MSFQPDDLAALAAILRRVAAAEILPRFRRLGPNAVRRKTGPLDLVTDADEAAEAAITRALEHAFPGVLVVGEEASARDTTLIGRLAAAPFAIVLDPIDGTANYAAGLPLFGVMAAVVEQGETTGAVILDPIVDSYSACLRGQGAAEHAADGSAARLRLANPAPLDQLSGMVSWRFMAPELRARVLPSLLKLALVWDHRCAAHEYRALIAGHAHFVIFNKLMPWDHLAGELLVTEAGGYCARFDGSPYRPGQTDGGLIGTTDKPTWSLLRQEILHLS